jgi:uncharacterized DUF497 family protein
VVVQHTLRFEWDPRKNRVNLRRHRVSFEEAATAFYDERAILIDDPDHSEAEDRFVLLGLSSSLRLLVVCHCYRKRSSVIRIISAWKADRQERQDYFGRFKP